MQKTENVIATNFHSSYEEIVQHNSFSDPPAVPFITRFSTSSKPLPKISPSHQKTTPQNKPSLTRFSTSSKPLPKIE